MLFYIKNGIYENCSGGVKSNVSLFHEKDSQFSCIDRFIAAKKRRKAEVSLREKMNHKEDNNVYYRNFK